MKQQFIDRAEMQVQKDSAVRRIEVVTAEAVVNSLKERGFDIEADYRETVAKLEVALKSGKKVNLQADYKNLAVGYDNLLALLNKLQ